MIADRLAPLLVSSLLLSACQAEPEPHALDRAEPPDARPTADAQAGPPDTSAADRTPETDPWLFEGIPNFEDLVAGREGDWLVVLGSAERAGRPEATIMRAADPRLAAIQQRVWNTGTVPFAVASEELPAFTPGLTVLVLGPYPRAAADERLAEMRGVVPDAYLKAGW